MNTDQKLPAESADSASRNARDSRDIRNASDTHDSQTASSQRASHNPLLGHATSHAATIVGLAAIVLWGFMAGLVRLVSESFGATLGSALIYTVGGALLFIVRRPKPISQAPRKYLIAGGAMFIAYEASISLSIGLATTNAQSVEVSLVNYLWPTLLVLMTAAVSRKHGAVVKAIPGAIVATIGVAMAVGGESLSVQEAVSNIASNPLPFALALAGAFIWAIYATFTPSLSEGYDGTTIFSAASPSCCGPSTSLRATACPPRLPASAVMPRCCVRYFDFRRLRMLGVRHAARQYGNVGDRLVRDPAVLHGFQHAAAGRRAGHAVLDWRRTGGGRLAYQPLVRPAVVARRLQLRPGIP